jgi:translation initiation factor IF-3
MINVESMPKQEGRNMIMVIAPNRRYLDQLARERAREQASAQTPEGASAPEAEPEPVTASPAEADEG